jgi:hypothetical protein
VVVRDRYLAGEFWVGWFGWSRVDVLCQHSEGCCGGGKCCQALRYRYLELEFGGDGAWISLLANLMVVLVFARNWMRYPAPWKFGDFGNEATLCPQSALLSMSGHSVLPSSKVGTFEARRSFDHSKFQETYILSFHIREIWFKSLPVQLDALIGQCRTWLFPTVQPHNCFPWRSLTTWPNESVSAMQDTFARQACLTGKPWNHNSDHEIPRPCPGFVYICISLSHSLGDFHLLYLSQHPPPDSNSLAPGVLQSVRSLEQAKRVEQSILAPAG